MPLVVHRLLKSIATTSGLHHFRAGLTFSFFLRKKSEKAGAKTQRTLPTLHILADASFSRLLSIFLSSAVRDVGSNEETELPHDQLLYLSNQQRRHTFWQWPFTPEHRLSFSLFRFASSVPFKLLLHTFGPPDGHSLWINDDKTNKLI